MRESEFDGRKGVKYQFVSLLPYKQKMAVFTLNQYIFGVDVISFESAKASAVLADKIFKGTPAGTIPVLPAEPFLSINYTVAQEFGLTIPEDLLKQANKVIK